MSPAALLGSPDLQIFLQDDLRGSCLLGFQLLTFLKKSFDLLPEQGCTLYTVQVEWGHVYSWDGFFGVRISIASKKIKIYVVVQ